MMVESNAPPEVNVELATPQAAQAPPEAPPKVAAPVQAQPSAPQGLLSAMPPAAPTPPEAGAEEAYVAPVLPDGFTPDNDLLEELKAIATRAKLPQTEVQGLADLGVKMHDALVEKLSANWVDNVNKWSESMRNHPTLGGDRFEESMRVARLPFNDDKMRKQFGSPLVSAELKQLLDAHTESNPHGMSLHCHPAVFEHFHTLGRLIGDDALISGAGKDAEITSLGLYKQMFPK